MRELAHAAYFDRVNLSANGFYKTPDIGYVWGANTGQMYYYFTQGVAAAEVEIDTLTGDWTARRVDLKMDVGRSINPAIDYGVSFRIPPGILPLRPNVTVSSRFSR